MTNVEFKELARHAALRTAPTEFTVASVDAALADELKRMTSSVNEFMRNKYDIFDIIVENADIVVPNKIMDAMGAFAETIVLGQGETKVFKRGGLGRNRAKKFLTQVGLSGVYESFRLDTETFTINMKAIGGAVSLDFERMLDGAETLAEFMDVLTEAQVDGIYGEVQKALMAAEANMPTPNKVVGDYSAEALVKLVNVVKAYGGAAVIFASPEFVAAMGPDAIVSGSTAYQAVYSPKDIEDIANYGRVRMFRGTPIVELPQSFVDENNEQVMIHPQYAYLLPAGKEKVVKVMMEGKTQIWDAVNRDQSIEINTYRKIGVGILTFNNWAIYQNTAIHVNDDTDGAVKWYDSSIGL